MERSDILENLKRTEAAVRETIEAANRQAAEMKDQAAKKARRLIAEGEAKVCADCDLAVATTRQELERERQRTLAAARADADSLKKRAKGAQARDFFISKFKEHVHV